MLCYSKVFLQPLIPTFRISESIFEERYKLKKASVIEAFFITIAEL